MKKIIFPIGWILLCAHMQAQTAFNNTGGLQIHGGSVSIFVPMTNASTASFVNNGSLYAKANITNDQASMANSSGTLFLDGNAAQSVNGTQPFRTFNLVTDNTNGITLNNDLSVGGAHTFTAGIITSSATPNYLAYEAGSSYTGASDNTHVNGWVSKTGTTGFAFPVGNGTVMRTIAVNSLSGSSVFNARYEGPTTNTSNVASPLLTVDPYEYWTVNRVSGGTAELTMNWDNSKINFPPYTISDVRVAEYSAGMWTNRGGSATGDVTTTGTITSGTLSSFGPFTFGSIAFVLPLKFTNLTAKRNESYTLVQWRTEQEINVDHFEIERKDKQTNSFVKIGTAKARNGQAANSYEYPDYGFLDGEAYYRVKSVDIDGKISYSNIAVVFDRNHNGYRINNPVSNSIYLFVDESYKGSYQYELVSAGGQIVQSGRLNITGAGTVNIPLSALVLKGNYVLNMKSTLHKITEKIVVK
jgi:hypothetical protein